MILAPPSWWLPFPGLQLPWRRRQPHPTATATATASIHRGIACRCPSIRRWVFLTSPMSPSWYLGNSGDYTQYPLFPASRFTIQVPFLIYSWPPGNTTRAAAWGLRRAPDHRGCLCASRPIHPSIHSFSFSPPVSTPCPGACSGLARRRHPLTPLSFSPSSSTAISIAFSFIIHFHPIH